MLILELLRSRTLRNALVAMLWWLWWSPLGGHVLAGSQQTRMRSVRRANSLLIFVVWALTAEGVDINSLDIDRDVLAARSRLCDTLARKKRPCHAGLAAEGKKRLARTSEALANSGPIW